MYFVDSPEYNMRYAIPSDHRAWLYPASGWIDHSDLRNQHLKTSMMPSQSTYYDVRWSKSLQWSIEYCCCSQPHSGNALCSERYHPCFLPRQGCVFHCLIGEYRLLWAHNLFSSQARAPHKPLGNLLVSPRLSVRGHLLPWWACCHLDAIIH